jgi:hypothetical protein
MNCDEQPRLTLGLRAMRNDPDWYWVSYSTYEIRHVMSCFLLFTTTCGSLDWAFSTSAELAPHCYRTTTIDSTKRLETVDNSTMNRRAGTSLPQMELTPYYRRASTSLLQTSVERELDTTSFLTSTLPTSFLPCSTRERERKNGQQIRYYKWTTLAFDLCHCRPLHWAMSSTSIQFP